MPIDATGGPNLGQDFGRNAEPLHNLLVPDQPVDVEQHGAGSIGIVRHMHRTLCQIPDEPGVHRAEEQLPFFRPFPGPGHMLQNPGNLGGAEIGVRHQAGLLPDFLVEAVLLQPLDHVRGAAALPYDGIVYRLSGILVPQNRSLPLVGDADGGYLLRAHACHGHALRGHR